MKNMIVTMGNYVRFKEEGDLMGQDILTDQELKMARSLADVFAAVDSGIRVNPITKQKLYEAAERKPAIRLKALEINKLRNCRSRR